MSVLCVGLGLGCVASGATRVTDDMMLSAARAVAKKLTKQELAQGAILPAVDRLRCLSYHSRNKTQRTCTKCMFVRSLGVIFRMSFCENLVVRSATQFGVGLAWALAVRWLAYREVALSVAAAVATVAIESMVARQTGVDKLNCLLPGKKPGEPGALKEAEDCIAQLRYDPFALDQVTPNPVNPILL